MSHRMFLAVFACGVLGLASPASADSGLDRCDDILSQDLFNKVNSSSQSSASERAAYAEHVYSLTDTQAYAEYESAYDSSKKQDTSGKLEGGYGWGFINGEGEFAHSYDRKLSKDEFSKKFEKNKAEHEKTAGSASSKDTSLISVYQSSVRDAGSVQAWERCMATKYTEPGLFAYGYRDDTGNPYIVVMWMPGIFAAANPTIRVKLNTTAPGLTIDGAAGPVDVASGSGVAFPIRFGNPNDKYAFSDGFAVLVNGELRSGDRLVQSFHSKGIVPRNIGPIPCSLVFTANRSFVLGVYDTNAKAMNWDTGLGFAMLGLTQQRTSKRRKPIASGGLPQARAVHDYNARLLTPGGGGYCGRRAGTTQHDRLGVRVGRP
ncbi:MAG: hypothetical protein JWO56_2687 [Acidobacteria bacterium]|nr:hypothetical protein [Acidobacteriota bacterium]